MDAGGRLPLAPQSMDLCLMATVLHEFVADGIADKVLQQVAEVLKPQGIAAVVEFKPQAGPPGPPRRVRLFPEEVAARLQPYGLTPCSEVTDLGPQIYLAQFSRSSRSPV